MMYRAFFLDENNRIFAFHLMECLDDGDAIAQAQELPAKCSTIEVWEGARIVGRTIRPRRTEASANPDLISASINAGQVSNEPPHVLVSLAMLELQANQRERAACLVDKVYAAFDRADLMLKTSAIERTGASTRPVGHSAVLPRSPLHHTADAGN